MDEEATVELGGEALRQMKIVPDWLTVMSSVLSGRVKTSMMSLSMLST